MNNTHTESIQNKPLEENLKQFQTLPNANTQNIQYLDPSAATASAQDARIPINQGQTAMKTPETPESVTQTSNQPQKAPLIKELDEKHAQPVAFTRLFRFATKKDKFLMVLGFIASALNGAALPAFSLLFGDIADTLGDGGDVIHDVGILSIEFFALGIGSFICSYISFASWMIAGERQAIEIRKRYFRSLLRQEIAFFDSINPNELSSKIASECFDIEGGIGEKVATFIYSISMFIVGFIIGYIMGWQLALVLTSIVPLMAVAGTAFVYSIQKQTDFTSKNYSEAGAISEEVLNSIKTVVALGGEEKEGKRYKVALDQHNKAVIMFAVFSGAAMGLVMFTMFGMYGLGFWYGAKLIDDGTTNAISGDPYTGGDVLTVFFSIMFAGFSISQATPAMKKFAVAKMAGGKAFQIIDRESKISVESEEGLKPEEITGLIEFKDVTFAYPLKPDRIVLDGISFKANPNEKLALVGESGCGKTTCLQLIERFYDLENGTITLDGNETKKLNLRWLRQHIGYVGQEPVLFATSIKENLLIAKEDATDEEIWEALRRANAEDFVSSLPHKLDTFVGTNAAQLSGGQKQRLAIARAILKNPRVLILDEATSALDRKNEREIQKTLDEISEGRTTISIAHRLTTIQNADRIIVFQRGKIVEEGKHEELVAKKGVYYALQSLQLKTQEEEVSAEQKQTGAPISGQNKEESEDEDDSSDDDDNVTDGHPEVPNERSIVIGEGKNLKQQNSHVNFKKPQNDHALKMEPTQKSSSITHKKQSTVETRGRQGEQSQESEEKDPNVVALEVEENAESQMSKKEKRRKRKQERKERKEKEKQEKKEIGPITSRLVKANNEKTWLLVLGLIFAAANGTVFPFTAIILAGILEIFTFPDDPDFRDDATLHAVYFIILGIGAFVFSTLQLSSLNLVGENLSKKLRIEVFKKYLYNEISWHDLPENAPGVLIAKLTTDASLVNSLASSVLGVFVQAFSSFITGTIIAFIASWELTLVSLALSPLTVISGAVQAKYTAGFSAENDVAYRESSNFVSEAVNNMRTVASFAREDKIFKNYETKLEEPLKLAVKKGNISGVAFGFSQFSMFFVYSVVFIVGAVFMVHRGLGYKDLFQSIFGVIFAAFGAGNAMQFAPDVGRARTAAISIFKILDRKPEIKIDDPSQDVTTEIKGNIEFKNVWFRYPTRPKDILKGVNFKINAAQKVAFVGPSGCGKSTIMNLLLRFYDATKGEILIDGVDIKKYNLRHLRNSFGVVSQEPTLFNGTIEYNIRYNEEKATFEEIRQAASEANALGFIEKNEFEDKGNTDPNSENKNQKGFDRKVGPKGGQISGGQKQRVAIARAILKKPHVLLLDEATSALDAQSEKVVQESLDHIMEGKTAIVIAHRISTIRDSDEILVFNEGEVIERGNYEALMEKKGIFYKLEKGLDLKTKPEAQNT